MIGLSDLYMAPSKFRMVTLIGLSLEAYNTGASLSHNNYSLGLDNHEPQQFAT